MHEPLFPERSAGRALEALFEATVDRRHLLRAGLVLAVSGGLPACSEVQAAPRPIKWGRDVCEFCHMTFGDRRFSAEWWDRANNRARIYDDFGCAVLAADEAGVLNDPGVAFWVSDDGDPAKWLDARVAAYRNGVSTPMGYGHSAGKGQAYPLDFAAAATAIRDKAACEHLPGAPKP